MLNTIRRAGNVLTLFTEDRPDWGVREVAAELEMPRSNAHELMSSLAAIGLLQRSPDARYRLGWRLLTLSGHLVNSTDVARIGSKILSHLATRHGQTVSLATLDSNEIVSIAQAEARGSAPVSRIGDRLPAHSTAGGKILLAHLAPEPEENLERLTRNTITDLDVLRRQLIAARRHHVAFDRQETDNNVICVASPIRDSRSGAVVAALTLCISPRDFERGQETYIRSALGAAQRISYLLTPDARAAAGPDTTSLARVAHLHHVAQRSETFEVSQPERADTASA